MDFKDVFSMFRTISIVFVDCTNADCCTKYSFEVLCCKL
jgi:hypothetical protein